MTDAPRTDNKIIGHLSSVGFTVLVLVIIIALCITGTLIPQRLKPAEYILRYGPVSYEFIAVLGLTDLFHSWYFLLTLILFGINLLLCTIRRIRWRWEKTGLLITHLGVLVVLAAAVTSALFSKRGIIELTESETKDAFITSSGRIEKLGFTLRLDSFSVKGYKSALSIIEEGKVVLQKSVEVNKPLSLKGFTFYQSGYNPEFLEWTSLEVVKDPGAGVIYAGFALLNIGIILVLFKKRGSYVY